MEALSRHPTPPMTAYNSKAILLSNAVNNRHSRHLTPPILRINPHKPMQSPLHENDPIAKDAVNEETCRPLPVSSTPP
ncbi:hypothetical protein NDU88_002043 [Pleurodeles waltl]|uniref:Uncharacterized protein n=1 Tax=Pleurodeles waltl TaxID=8319 RepID=A0AAV7V9H0_PLEWA|nr:hypothetical protein NDU88_002043 [Pleurodeles waltl]